ncbi:hypothetical protein M0G74_16970 [Microbulbifer sp. CAU 1566]|uniref:hypothetical protein n=1 Tax=Microbulbifer sp. CAU 1566 TaxID=2933269 RepID=UPI0020037FB2|nr:hypothetical protein [Microbulbifer sp. CAU 1566]MCK7598968.1 hypothetical protein [Microbulbifer sp. CAU 1566]
MSDIPPLLLEELPEELPPDELPDDELEDELEEELEDELEEELEDELELDDELPPGPSPDSPDEDPPPPQATNSEDSRTTENPLRPERDNFTVRAIPFEMRNGSRYNHRDSGRFNPPLGRPLSDRHCPKQWTLRQ